jgi:hypothetical protein
MVFRVAFVCLALSALPAAAGSAAPEFGSASQGPVIVVVDPLTGLPATPPAAVVATAR